MEDLVYLTDTGRKRANLRLEGHRRPSAALQGPRSRRDKIVTDRHLSIPVRLRDDSQVIMSGTIRICRSMKTEKTWMMSHGYEQEME